MRRSKKFRVPSWLIFAIAIAISMLGLSLMLSRVTIEEKHAPTSSSLRAEHQYSIIPTNRREREAKFDKFGYPEEIPGDFSITESLKRCVTRESRMSDFKTEFSKRVGTGCPESRLSVDDFVCAAKCDEREPELEKAFNFLSLSRYSFSTLSDLCKEGRFAALILIKQNKPYFTPCKDRVYGKSNWEATQRLIVLLLCMVKVPDVLFGFDTSDWVAPPSGGGVAGWLQPLPGIVRYVGTESHPSLLFPTPPFIKATTHCNLNNKNRLIYSEICKFDGAKFNWRWELKEDSIFWRGSTTGVPLERGFLQYLPRPSFMTRFYGKEGYNVAFTGGDPPTRKNKEYIEFFHKAHGEYVPREQFSRYKYLMHMDGHTASWGLAYKLLSLSTVLWVPSAFTFREFYYIHLKPWKHFIPVSINFSNLEDIRRWLLDPKNSERARLISESAYKVFNERLRPEATYCYVLRLFLSLSQVQQQAPDAASLAEAGLDVSDFRLFPEYEYF